MNRKEIAQQIKVWLIENKMDDVYGVLEGQLTPNNNPKAVIAYTLSFCQSARTDGEVLVYSPTKIVVKFTTTIRALPHNGNVEFKSYDEFIAYMEKFVC